MVSPEQMRQKEPEDSVLYHPDHSFPFSDVLLPGFDNILKTLGGGYVPCAAGPYFEFTESALNISNLLVSCRYNDNTGHQKHSQEHEKLQQPRHEPIKQALPQ